jgi:hypothetical protein
LLRAGCIVQNLRFNWLGIRRNFIMLWKQ